MNESTPRFTKGKLVMFSRKPIFRDKIPYYNYNSVVDRKSLPIAGYLSRGVPFLLTENPEILSQEMLTQILGFMPNKGDKFFWKITILLDEQVYQIFLTKRQYNHELVKAVERRIVKDYTRGSNKIFSQVT